MNYLRPVKGRFYDPDAFGIPLIEDLPFLFDADSHHHERPCGLWCLRSDVLVVSLPDSEDGGVQS